MSHAPSIKIHEHVWRWKGWLFGREGQGEIFYCTDKSCNLLQYAISDDYSPWEKRKEKAKKLAPPIVKITGGQPIPVSAAS